MRLDDLAAHRTEVARPWRLGWQGGEVLAHPPNSHGSTALLALGAIEGGDADEPGWTHAAIEAFKHAFALRDTRFGDPDATLVEERDVTGTEAIAAVRARIDPERVQARFRLPGEADTIAIVAVDDEGRAVSLIESLYMNFGSGLVAEGTGIVLHNRGAYFNLLPGHPNELTGGHRPVHTLSPAMFLRGGQPEFVYGTMGGDGQPQIHVQLLHAVYERGLDVQSALDAPRWIAGRPHIPGRTDALSDTVLVESRMAPEVVDGLRARGHAVEALGAFENTMGHAHAIRIDREHGTLAGGSDPRADSLALGL
jgi:gamma-glutamyltranspeptidase/glutathione hydrolase